MSRLRIIVLSGLWCLAGVVLMPGTPTTAQTAATGEHSFPLATAGSAFDAVPFGYAVSDEDGKAHGVRWAEMRKIRRVVVEFAEGTSVRPEQVRLQYRQRGWDGGPDPVMGEQAAGGMGWDVADDWSNGNWITAKTRLKQEGNRWTYTFEPTGPEEFEKFKQQGVSYRKTLWIRLVSEAPMPRPTRIQAFTDSVYQPLTVRLNFGKPAEPKFKDDGGESGRLEPFNGQVLAVRGCNQESKTLGNRGWNVAENGEGCIEADLLMAVDPVDRRYDRSIFTVRSSSRPFSFAADEVARGERILVDDLGVLVTRGNDTIGLEAYRQARTEFAGKTVYDRVPDKGEQTLARAWDAMPLKRPLWFVHGLPGDRNAVRQNPDGSLSIASWERWFQRVQKSPRDSDRKGWKGDQYVLEFGFPREELRGGRELKDGYLPLLRTWWQEGPVYYEQSTILDKLDGDLSQVRLDDPTLVLMKVRVVNTSAQENGTARLRFWSPTDRGELTLKEDKLIRPADGQERLRAVIRTGGRGELAADRGAVRWSLQLRPGEAHELFVLVPTITLTEEHEIKPLRARNFEADAERICAYWRDITARGTQITTPEEWINDFYKAHVRHLLVNCQKELDTPFLHAHVGTFRYGVYPNESAMMISDLDRRGYHEEARNCLDMFLHYQGTVGMPGNFKSTEGQLYGAGGHETGGYNKSHGYVLWNLAQHWWYTRDQAWMQRQAERMIKACDWVTRERQATMKTDAQGRKVLEYGFLPSGSLEDVTDYWHWLATNAATVWGMLDLADALADSGHPEGPRLQKDAKAYYDDFMRGVNESRIQTAVVKLRDGTYVPKFPSKLYERGRSHGWIREVLEGSIFLPAYGLIAPDAPETRWIMKDYEDNLYIAGHEGNNYGYSIPVFSEFWFSRGGFSMQACLLDSPLPYLWRDEIGHYVRTYFNSFASGYFPEIRMHNEHALPELGYPRGDHFKSSDEAQSTYWLRLMFVNERGKDLYLGQAIPRYWLNPGRPIGITNAATRFGRMSLAFSPERGEIKALLEPPQRNRPETIYLRFRHPDAKPIRSVTVGGKPYDRFDVKKEWVILGGDLKGPVEVIAKY